MPAAPPQNAERTPHGGPRFRSRFGGLWTDLSNARQVLAGKLELGRLDGGQAELLNAWIEHGFVVIEDAVPHAVIDAVRSDIESAWRGDDDRNCAEYLVDGRIDVGACSPERRSSQIKLLNMHAVSKATRDAIFAPEVAGFLDLVFERPPLAMSTLAFERGTRQPLHQDTAFVGFSSPLEFAASWIALEDAVGVCGQLEYYVGSHRIDEIIFDNGERCMPAELHNEEAYPVYLQQQCQALGLERVQFAPRKGDALIWSADLVHGGSQRVDPGTTRRSLVTHYCPVDVDPSYFAQWKHSGRVRHAPGRYYAYYDRL